MARQHDCDWQNTMRMIMMCWRRPPHQEEETQLWLADNVRYGGFHILQAYIPKSI